MDHSSHQNHFQSSHREKTNSQVTSDTVFTCPMHPEIRQKGPGTCPICGMALEPEKVTLEQGENPELVDFSKRFKVSLFLSIPLFLLAMSDMIPGQPLQHSVNSTLLIYVQFLLATPVVLWCGLPLIKRGYDSLKFKSLNMFTLIAMGTLAAYVYSLVATFAPGLFPENYRVHGELLLFIMKQLQSSLLWCC